MNSPITRMAVSAGYDIWSTIYDEDLNPLVLLEEPLVHSWLGQVRGQRVVDVGCGTGRHSLWLAQNGAILSAFDASAGMRARANQKLQPFSVEVVHHEMPARLPLGDGSQDLALFALVADHIADLTATFVELRRVVRPGGQIVFTVLHPAMNLKGVTARFTHPQDGIEVRVAAFEHTFSDYVMAVLDAGLKIEEMVEQRVDETLTDKTPRAEKYLGWPMLAAMRLRKEG